MNENDITRIRESPCRQHRRPYPPSLLAADEPPMPSEPENHAVTESLVIRLDGRKHRVGYEPGDTLLDAARRAGLRPPFACQAGNCATCMAYLEEGTARMRANNALDAGEVEEGWILTCQAIPTSQLVVVDYDR
jgi:ferredoxin